MKIEIDGNIRRKTECHLFGFNTEEELEQIIAMLNQSMILKDDAMCKHLTESRARLGKLIDKMHRKSRIKRWM